MGLRDFDEHFKKGERKWILVVLAAFVPILIYMLADAADIIGVKKDYALAFYSTTVFLVSIEIGFCGELITGYIGGGGFIITPALMAAGVRGILAVGTD